jgi:glycosyltransferase involved in cell wall biosynthesis
MNILFLSVHFSSFVKKDYEILERVFNLEYIDWEKKEIPGILSLIEKIKRCDILFCWFASLSFFLPVIIARVLNKKVVIVAGGYDVAKVKEINYGSCNIFWKSIIVKMILRLSNKVISISKSNREELKHNCKMSDNRIELIYHGFEYHNEEIDLSQKKDIIITTGYINNTSFMRKGIDRFFKLAEYLPDIEFHMTGQYDLPKNKYRIPENVILDGFLDNDNLLSLMAKAKIYIQFSRHEGFGCSVSEAMQSGCIPVVSNSYSLPEVIGNNGLIIDDFNDFTKIALKVKELLSNYSIHSAQNSIKWVNNNFDIKKREISLLKLINIYS